MKYTLKETSDMLDVISDDAYDMQIEKTGCAHEAIAEEAMKYPSFFLDADPVKAQEKRDKLVAGCQWKTKQQWKDEFLDTYYKAISRKAN